MPDITTFEEVNQATKAIEARLEILKEVDPKLYAHYQSQLKSVRDIAVTEYFVEIWMRKDGTCKIPKDLSAKYTPVTAMALQAMIDALNEEPCFEHMEKI